MIDPVNYKIYFYSGTLIDGGFIEIDGVNNLSFSKNISVSEAYFLGGLEAAKNINAPQEIQLSFDRSFVQKDYFLNYTGKDPILKFFVYDGSQYYEMSNMYLKSYSAAFSVGDLPKINTTFISYGTDIQESETLRLGVNNPVYTSIKHEVDIPNLDSIYITGDFDDNFKSKYKIFGFDYNIEMNRQVYYSVGSAEPVEVSTILPLRITSSINSKVSSVSKNLAYPNFVNPNEKYLTFDIVVSGSGYLFNLPMKKATLVNMESQFSSQNTLEIKRNFIGYHGLL
jgi:hypothetical protein